MKYKLSVYFIDNSSVKMILNDKVKAIEMFNKYLNCIDCVKVTIKKLNANA